MTEKLRKTISQARLGEIFRKTLPWWLLGLILLTAVSLEAASQEKKWEKSLRSLSRSGAVIVEDAKGRRLAAINPDIPLVPASTLKIVTAAAAFHTLGPEYRFLTEFRLSDQGDLHVTGRGDPYLVSEELAYIVGELKAKGLKGVRNIYLDNSYFAPGLVLHGTSRSLNPYDAYNGALCVNFNTIYALVGKNGQVQSAEPQTPLSPMARELALKSGVRGQVRFNLAQNPETCLLYAGDLLKTFLQQAGVPVTGMIQPVKDGSQRYPLFYQHRSRKNLTELVASLFKYSNNFMTNQIFLVMGAEKYGPPASPEKSRQVMADFFTAQGLPVLHIEEGSGLSRKTKITAGQMIAILHLFKPYRRLLTNEGAAWFKTGTLMDVKAMAGYLVSAQGESLCFVILLNGPGVKPRTRDRILSLLEKNLL